MADPRGAPGWLLSGQTSSGLAVDEKGSTLSMDCRMTETYGYYMAVSETQSARFIVQASVDNISWMPALIITALAATATGQISTFYPYVRAIRDSGYGGGGATATTAWLFWHPGLKPGGRF